MYALSSYKKVQVILSLVEGNSIRATCRITGTAKGTVGRLLTRVGKACMEYQDVVLRNLPCKQIQCDEIWAYCYAKDKNVPEQYKGKFGFGDVWTWVAIDADTKLVPSWYIGLRDTNYALRFMHDLKNRLSGRIQITTDGHSSYLWAIENTFGSEVDYAMIVKLYGQ